MHFNKLFALLVIIIVLAGCSSGNKKAVKSDKKTISVPEKGRFEEEITDFRKVNWGATQQEVTKSEIDKDVFDIADIGGVGLYDEVLEINTLVIYQFENSKLVKGVYSASGKDVNEEKYNEIKSILNKKYGSEKIFTDEKTGKKIMEWKNKRTVVVYSADFENANMKLEYYDISYYNMINNKTNIQDDLF